MSEIKYPRVLVFSNNCFSETNNNGRTLGNFFYGWPRENLAQFYIKAERPWTELCANYMNVTDGQALKAAMGKKLHYADPSEMKREEKKPEQSDGSDGKKKTAFTMYVRNFIWKTNRWRNAQFEKFVDDFKPEMVMLQAGDSPFMYKIAAGIAKKKNIPFVMYNSEDHVLRKKNYFIDAPNAVLSYKMFRHTLQKEFKRALSQADFVIYNSEKLQNTYKSLYGEHKSDFIYTSTSVKNKVKESADDPLTVSYFGNFYPDRAGVLTELANAFKAADSRIKLNVYGRAKDKDLETLTSCDAVDYHGFVSYEELKCVMENSDIIVHAESFSDYFANFNAHYFSTKIADCLACGKPLLVYAPANIAFVEYISKNNAGIVINSKDALEGTVAKAVKSREFRESTVSNALKLAADNHDLAKNREKFGSIIMSVCGGKR